MTTPRYRARPARGSARLARVLMLSGFAVASGAGATFLAIAFAWAAGAEVDPMTWGSGAVNAMMRQSVGAAAIAIGVSLGVGAIAQGAFRLLYVRQLAREAELEPDGRLGWSDRQITSLQTPFFGTWIYGVYFLVFGGIAITIFALVLGGHPDDPFSQFMLGAASVLTLLMAGLMILTMTVGKRAWNRATDRIRAVWPPQRNVVREPSDDAEARIRSGISTFRRIARRTGVSAGVAAIAASVPFMIAVHARKPCRRCDLVYYDDPGEIAIDVLMSIAIPFAVIAVIVAVLSLVTLWLASLSDWIAVSRLAAVRADAPDPAVLARLLHEWWPGSTAGFALVAIGWGAAPVVTGADLAAPGIPPDSLVPVLLVVGAVGVVLLWWAVGAAARSENRLRQAWQLGDIPPPSSGNRARKRKNRAHPR